MNLNDVKIFSFFSGAGFLDLGFETSGYNIAFVNEYSTAFLNAYRYSRRNMGINEPTYGYFNGDIGELLTKRQDEFDSMINEQRNNGNVIGFIGGPPCPDFSVGGKNRGKNGDNGKLSATYVNVICHGKPDFFLFENVKGLWRTKSHREYFDELKRILHANGYLTTERLINSIEYGAPQDRERIILMGFGHNFLRSLGHTIVEGQLEVKDFPWANGIRYDREVVFSNPWPTIEPFNENLPTLCPDNIPEELTVEFWFSRNQVYNHPNANDFFQPRQGLVKMQTIGEGDDKKKSYKRLHRWRYSPTAAYGNNEVHLHPYKARRISVAEALAIQSLPANFILPSDMTLSDKFKTVGNGVPYLAAKGLADAIKTFLEG